jgi:hypothetical protein
VAVAVHVERRFRSEAAVARAITAPVPLGSGAAEEKRISTGSGHGERHTEHRNPLQIK